MEVVLHGFTLALGLIIPLGVQNIFVFSQEAVQPTSWRALPAILTAAMCDTLLILLAVFGVSLAALQFAWLKTIVFAVGVLFLLYIGWSIWKSRPSEQKNQMVQIAPVKQITFAAAVSLLNPHALLDTIGVIGTSSLRYEAGEKWMFTLTTITVSWCWFFALAGAGRILGRLNYTGNWLGVMNRISALMIWSVAIYLAFSVVVTP